MKIVTPTQQTDFIDLLMRVIDYTAQQAIIHKDREGLMNGIQIIEALLYPYLDEEYDKKVEELEEKFKLEVKDNGFFDLNKFENIKRMQENLEFAKLYEKFKLLMKVAHKRKLLPIKSYSAVVE